MWEKGQTPLPTCQFSSANVTQPPPFLMSTSALNVWNQHKVKPVHSKQVMPPTLALVDSVTLCNTLTLFQTLLIQRLYGVSYCSQPARELCSSFAIWDGLRKVSAFL